MSRDNPFNDNPFDDSAISPYTTGSATNLIDTAAQPASSSSAGAWGTANGGGAWGSASKQARAPLPPAPAGVDPMKQASRVDSLAAKEAELAKKEAELKAWEEELKRAGAVIKKKNWPKCFPITHHDIPGDIPPEHQWMVRMVYWSYLGLCLALTVNFVGGICALVAINPSNGRLVGFFLAAIYWVCGIPGAWILWYKRLYNAAIKDRAVTYAWFFLMYLVHLIFSTWSAVAPPFPGTSDWSHTGYITGIKAFSSNTFTGIIYVIGAGIWTLEVVWSLNCLRVVYHHFRGSGGDSKKIKQEMARSAALQTLV